MRRPCATSASSRRALHEGKETLGIRLSWDKRYITLGPKATLVGLAFRLFDPENLLGKGEDVGITLALIPANHPGVNIGRRHLPSGAAFPNGPNWGKDVFIPMDWVIGGDKMAGHGWRMLMECLSAGRAISLPSSATAGAKTMLRVTIGLRAHPQAVRPARLAHGGHRRAARAHHRDGLRQRSRARHDGVDGVARRKAVGHLGADEVPDDREDAPRRQRRDGHSRRPRHLRRPVELPAVGLSDGAGRHHGRRRQHPDAHADHVRARRAALASLSLQGSASRRRTPTAARARRVRGGVRRAHRVFAVECDGRLLPQRDGRRACVRAGQRAMRMSVWYRQLARAVALVRVRRRPDGGAARRRPQDQAEDHRPHGRRAVGTLHAVGRAQALRGRRPAAGRSPHRRACGTERRSIASRRRWAARSTISRTAGRAR